MRMGNPKYTPDNYNTPSALRGSLAIDERLTPDYAGLRVSHWQMERDRYFLRRNTQLSGYQAIGQKNGLKTPFVKN
ncbi:MAG: hypothetical protein QJT81_11335 [Candidatus Thiothrix putei]|uniref:Uncharacterized protein n=1 Tax=Candidatus Thiothrix putei TaxID=3080811 RepID=A0AA95HAH5_9GAMM|nr:MAG: hypothetical protein QJT81_11335 [Candidatus Thiothrix putei]